MKSLDGKIFHGKPIVVQKFLPKAKRRKTGWKTNLYLKGFPSSWDEDKVREFINEKFNEYGTITSMCIKRSEKFNTHFAFVAYEDAEKAESAMNGLQDFKFEEDGASDPLFVGFAQRKHDRKKHLQEKFAKSANDTNLFIKSLRADVTEELIREAFGRFGEITSIGLKKATRLPKALVEQGVEMKFGFINFREALHAKRAFAEGKKDPVVRGLLAKEHDFRKEFLFFAQPKAVREQYLRMQRKNMMSTMMLQQQMMLMNMMFTQNMASNYSSV